MSFNGHFSVSLWWYISAFTFKLYYIKYPEYIELCNKAFYVYMKENDVYIINVLNSSSKINLVNVENLFFFVGDQSNITVHNSCQYLLHVVLWCHRLHASLEHSNRNKYELNMNWMFVICPYLEIWNSKPSSICDGTFSRALGTLVGGYFLFVPICLPRQKQGFYH